MRKTTICMGLLTIGFIMPIALAVLQGGFWPGTSIYVGHLLDLILNAPFLLAVMLGAFLAIHHEGTSDPKALLRKSLAIWLAAGFALLLFEGHGIHYAANSLSPLIDRRHGPPELVSLNYFYDEILGHWMLLTGFSGLLYVLMIYEASRPNSSPCSTADVVVVTLSAIVSGLSCTLVILEGQFPWLGFPFFLTVAVTAFCQRLHHGWYRSRPLGTYLLLVATTVIIALTVWAIRFDGFVQPLAGPFKQ